MPAITITIDLDEAPWYGFSPEGRGEVVAIGVLPRGMTSGNPSIAMNVVIDNKEYFVEMSLRQFQIAAEAFQARWGRVSANQVEFIAPITKDKETLQ